MARIKYPAFGKWHVTTEDDCEGKTTKDLGVYEGFIDEIAFSLGSKAYYQLKFEIAKELPKPEQVPPVNMVNVSFGIESGTWDMKPDERVDYFKNLLKGRKVSVQRGTSYASVTLIADEEKARENLKRRALEKLTSEEKQALGL